jgi:hypothetical protein
MKILLILMIVSSLFVGIPINGSQAGWASLYGYEYDRILLLMKGTGISTYQVIISVLLLTAHLGLICLPLFIKKSYFKDLLIIIPASFLILYLLSAALLILLLIPFILLWLGALVNRQKYHSTRV